MLREIQEIRELALEYSKDQLGRMVQLGLVDPQKALLAGMMIQRVEQQNAKPPEGTVAQNLLGVQPPGAPAGAQQPQMPTQMAQGQPQMPPQGAPAAPPPMMAAEGGLMAIPAGDIGEYAGGGIVAFDDGGEVEGYAKGDLVPAGLFEALVQAESRGKQSAVSNKGARGVAQLMPGTMRDPGYGIKPVRDDSEEENRRVGREYLGAMLKKYRGDIDNALAAYNWGPGNVDKHLKKYGELTPEKLPKETRSYIPKVKNFLAQQRPMEPRPVRVAENVPADINNYDRMDVPAGKRYRTRSDRSGASNLLQNSLGRLTQFIPSAQAEEIAMDSPAGIMSMDIPAGFYPQTEYAKGGIASFAGNQGSVVQETSSPVGRVFSPIPRTLNKIFAPSPEAVRAYNIQQDIDAQIRQKTEEINQLGGMFGLAQQTPEQQRLYDQKKDELRALYNLKKTGGAPPSTSTSLPPPPEVGARDKRTQAYPVEGGWDYVKEDMFPLSSATDLGERRKEGIYGNMPKLSPDDPRARALFDQHMERGRKNDKTSEEAPPSAGRKDSAGDFVTQARSIADSIYSDKPSALTVRDAMARSNELLREAGVDLDAFKKQKADIAAERRGAVKDKEEAKTFRILEAAANILGGQSQFAAVNIGKGMAPAIQGLGSDVKEFQKNERALRAAVRDRIMAEQKFNLTRASDAQAQMLRAEDRIDAFNKNKAGIIDNLTGRLISNAGSKDVAETYVAGTLKAQQMKQQDMPDIHKLANSPEMIKSMPNTSYLDRVTSIAKAMNPRDIQNALLTSSTAITKLIEEKWSEKLTLDPRIVEIAKKAKKGDAAAAEQLAQEKRNLASGIRNSYDETNEILRNRLGIASPTGSNLSSQDLEALKFANENPNDPRSQQIKQLLGVR